MEIPYYERFVSKKLLDHLKRTSVPVNGIPHLKQIGSQGGLETKEALTFLCQLYEIVRPRLETVLKQREIDRKFLDERTHAAHELNRTLKTDLLDPSYETVLGQTDSNGKIVAGPTEPLSTTGRNRKKISPLPQHLEGPHVTLFGPPDDAKLSINAMNAYHRRIKGEPGIVEELLRTQTASPMWGADDEDSKTPLRNDLILAGEHLAGCFERTLQFEKYRLEKSHLSLPIKRFPGIALPGLFLFYKEASIPLHLYDFALHFYRFHKNAEALSFYVPKLETPDEAAYIHFMIEEAENQISKHSPGYKKGSVRLLVVLENPRAIFRTHEIIDALYPYFAGASLGWHDFLSSTARLFKNDSNYRIPVKADPEIVINYIKASHTFLADAVGSRGGIKIGGMYGVLPMETDRMSPSFQITMKGFIKDVITQLKRDLSGFWVAHPDFVRIGLAFVEAFRFFKNGDKSKLETLVQALLDKTHHQEILEFIHGSDVKGLDVSSPLYPRSLIVADLKGSAFIANNDPEEIRYNVFQTLQYLTDWLAGNGCVALPSQIEGTPVRVMDDLATAERSRWEVWNEIHHGRFPVEDFIKIAHEEMVFIRKNLSDEKKIVQVKWDERTAKWYPISLRLMLQLMTAQNPPEFSSELLLPFTVEEVRHSSDPWKKVLSIAPEKYGLETYVENFHELFSICGSKNFATALAKNTTIDPLIAEKFILEFSLQDVKDAAYFHGDIGESKSHLDSLAKGEQALVQNSSEKVLHQLKTLGKEYQKKFGIKFLISAKDKTAEELLKTLEQRIQNTKEQELQNAKEALWEITKKRLLVHPLCALNSVFRELLPKHNVPAAQICISTGTGYLQDLSYGTTANTWFELASLSKVVATAFAMEFFRKKDISIDSPVNSLLANTRSDFRIPKGDGITLRHLFEHSALNLHYIEGSQINSDGPSLRKRLESLRVIGTAGETFHYSGGGFLVLEHLIEALEDQPIQKITKPFLSALGVTDLTFEQEDIPGITYAGGFFEDGKPVPGGRLIFPSFAAGAMGTASGFCHFLTELSKAFHDPLCQHPISHDTAVQMLHGTDKGSRAFMGAKMGLGIFTLEAGPNRFMVHQGANEGFRCLFAYCYEGPDRDKGFTVLCNANNNGVLFIVETAQILLQALNIKSIDTQKFKRHFDFSSLSQEQIVNLGYKELLFEAFEEDLPEKIVETGPKDPIAPLNLAIGAEILSTSNQSFARAENLVSAYLPVYDPQLYGRQGKIMDSWETARHNPKPFDELVLRLKNPAAIAYATFSTQFHLGNQAPYVRLEARTEKGNWEELVPKTPLDGHSFKCVKTKPSNSLFEYVRVSIFPDGGLTRLGLFREAPVATDQVWNAIPKSEKPAYPLYVATPEKVRANWGRLKPGDEVDLASNAFGGRVVSASNEHYGPASQVISPYPPLHMFDGFESSRSRTPEHSENFVIHLGKPGRIHRLEVDFSYFRNNNPREIRVEAFARGAWRTLFDKKPVKAYAGNTLVFEPPLNEESEEIRVTLYPDGGLNRVRAFSFY